MVTSDMAPHGKPMTAANFRLPLAIVDGVDAAVKRANDAAGYDKFNRSDLIRELLEEALRARGLLGKPVDTTASEAQAPQKKRGAR